MKINDRKIVIINQAINYLTIGICNEFANKFENVSIITGNIHVQGEKLNKNIEITFINKWIETHGLKKIWVYFKALIHMYFLLVTKYRKHEVFFVSVPPMAYLLNLAIANRFSMIIWDVYPDVLKITGMKENHFIYKIWSRLNKLSFKKAYRIITIGERMADLIANYIKRDKIIVQPIWSIFQENSKVMKSNNPFVKAHNLSDKFIVQYSGNIGVAHNVEIMVELAEKMIKHPHISFQIIGRGPRKVKLRKLVEDKKLINCHFLPFQTDEMFPLSLSAADLGIVILDDLASKGSVPSKSYNLMSFGIPSLYISASDSELNDYANKYNHAKCFEKNDFDAMITYILNISNDKKIHTSYKENALKAAKKFKRDNAKKIVDKYLLD